MKIAYLVERGDKTLPVGMPAQTVLRDRVLYEHAERRQTRSTLRIKD